MFRCSSALIDVRWTLTLLRKKHARVINPHISLTCIVVEVGTFSFSELRSLRPLHFVCYGLLLLLRCRFRRLLPYSTTGAIESLVRVSVSHMARLFVLGASGLHLRHCGALAVRPYMLRQPVLALWCLTLSGLAYSLGCSSVFDVFFEFFSDSLTHGVAVRRCGSVFFELLVRRCTDLAR